MANLCTTPLVLRSFVSRPQGPARAQAVLAGGSKAVLRCTCSADDSENDSGMTAGANDPSGVLSRRGVLGALAATAVLQRTSDAQAGFNPDLLQPCTSLNQCRNTLDGINKDLEADPDDLDSEGLKYFFESEVDRLEKNKQFVDSASKSLKSGENRFLQRITLSVERSQFDNTVDFWTKGMGMKVQGDSADTSGLRTVTVTYGDETLLKETGGNFAIELVESVSPSQPAWLSSGSQLKYIQVAIGNVRMGNIVDSGADVLYSYGYLELIAPDGTLVKSRVGTRRDPIELLCYEVDDIEASVRYYEEVLGMKVLETTPKFECSQVKKGALGALGFAKRECVPPPYNTFNPRNVPGSVLLSYGGMKDSVGVLLSPRAPLYNPPEYTPEAAKMVEPAAPGTRYQSMSILTKDGVASARKAEVDGAKVELEGKVPGIGVKGSVVRDANGYGIALVDYDDFEKTR
mmetsp:Transcript_7373/g.15036  ORF Transcript_7373/g.15036 Transcript_7373/m.15036 type:complete len:460 (-) Transcript_7373:393-1772(-)|eukprot:CAMPEP_0118954826 /NCGR_PEP_ID=MMETSP1169-20130426/58950_1 /TAXON_ID=36882 /ORGANISM="Pyramimonas obovata, Strain CCMP722" /LENGTH=459 /DNA_ID=CAMNT_0006902525 /DNA_START=56 /DNA_END=1435 /DNA_ORIENTATION=-